MYGYGISGEIRSMLSVQHFQHPNYMTREIFFILSKKFWISWILCFTITTLVVILTMKVWIVSVLLVSLIVKAYVAMHRKEFRRWYQLSYYLRENNDE